VSGHMEIQNAREGNKCVRGFGQNPCMLEFNQEIRTHMTYNTRNVLQKEGVRMILKFIRIG